VTAGRRRAAPAGASLPRPLAAAAALLAAALATAGCAAGRAAPATAADPDAAPWQVPAGALGSQRLYRVSYDGPDGGGGFRLSLRLAAPERYQVRAVDPVGRALWSLDVAGAGGLWLDHRAAAACRLTGSLDLAAGQLTPFPLASLPALLLGRLPAAPAGPLDGPGGEAGEPVAADAAETAPPDAVPDADAEEDTAGDRRLAFADAQGRRWSATLAGGAPLSWAMTEPGDAAPSVWWRRHDGEHLLSDRARGVQLRWRESVVEPLPGPLAPLEVPEGFALVPCATLYERPRPEPGA
jgi:hypothetical protein